MKSDQVAAPASDASHVRFNESVLAHRERQLLLAIVSRLPRWVTPNRLTLFGIFGSLVVTAGYLLSNRAADWLWLANLGLVLHWLGDSLDGTLARHRRIERPRYGFYLDQVIDTLGNTFIALGVGFAPWVRMDMALLVLATYHMLSIQVYVRAIVDREFHLAVGRLGPTEMRVGIILLNIAVLLTGTPRQLSTALPFTWVDILLGGVAVGLLAMFAMQMRRHLQRFAHEDPQDATVPM